MLHNRNATTILFKDAQGVLLIKCGSCCLFEDLNLNLTYIIFNPFIKNCTQENSKFL